MSEPVLMQEALAGAGRQARSTRVVLDSRRPQLLDHREHLLQVVSGHVDLFAVGVDDGRVGSVRQHLFRVERGEIIPDFPQPDGPESLPVRVLAVGSPGAEAVLVVREDIEGTALVQRWIGRLSGLIAGPNQSWAISEDETDGAAGME